MINKLEFCEYIRSLNRNYVDVSRTEAYYEINALKETIDALKKIKQTKDVQTKIKELSDRVKFYEGNINDLGLITPEELVDNLEEDSRIYTIEYDINEASLKVYTNDIEFCGYNIGGYVISVFFSDKDIKINRQDGVLIDGYDHVFVKGGKPCFGDQNEKASASLNSGGFYSLIQLCFSLLSSRTSNHSGAYIPSKTFLTKLGRYKNEE